MSPFRTPKRLSHFRLSIFRYPLLTRSYAITKVSDPLRILFCGSDDFSIASLKALHHEHKSQPDFIKSIDVVCKPAKRVGRGLKKVREVPIAETARELSLPLHQINTFTGWQPPRPEAEAINLIVTVSFGLFVPSRILKGAKYGGLNVHPSLLPDFRGSAPLHHALLAGCTRTGVSLQTLHDKHFDHGIVLARTPLPGFQIPNHDGATVPELLSLVAPKGADMLVQGIRERLYVPPLQEVQQQTEDGNKLLTRPAPKIVPDDRHIDWGSWTSETILRKQRILGSLWNTLSVMETHSQRTHHKRIIWSSSFQKVANFPKPLSPGQIRISADASTSGQGINDPRVYVGTTDGQVLRTEMAKLESERAQPAARALGNLVKSELVFDPAIEESGYLNFKGTL
ncbi:MAG: hypothetical protein Q9187_008254, partial [Circinaria calcarea]